MNGLSKMNLTVDAELSNIAVVQKKALSYALQAGCNTAVCNKIDLIIEEMMVNIIEHGYQGRSGKINFTCKASHASQASNLELCFIDQGVAFNPLSRKKETIETDLQQTKPGGLGIFLTAKFAESIEYKYKNNSNHLIITMRCSN